MKFYNLSDTIIAPITPSIGGSVALIRISGNNAIHLSNKFFKEKDLEQSEGGRFYFGKMFNEDRKVIDEVIVLVYRKPYSFTGEDVVEMCFHANPFIIHEVIDLFIKNGCRIAEPGEFSKRAFINNKIDLIQAEAIADLIASKSKASTKNSLSMLNGELSRQITSLKDNLIKTLSLIELSIDFSEERLEIVSTNDINQTINEIIKKIDIIIMSYDQGRMLKKGLQVLITGKPNVGKSSLMNALLGTDRVIVSSSPGTTRDYIQEDIMLDNTLVRLIDTAGIHKTNNSIEADGIEKTKVFFEKADVIFLLVDMSQPFLYEDISLIKTISSIYQEKLILVGNKSDLPKCEDNINYLKTHNIEAINISALHGTNVQELKNQIIRKLTQSSNSLPEEFMITNERHKNALDKIKTALSSVFQSIENNTGYEFIAVDIRTAIEHLSELTGEISTEDILNNIFSNFCIGK